jgi:hypothetical protein
MNPEALSIFAVMMLREAIAKEVLAGWEAHLDHRPSSEERVERVIYYARFDA